PLISSLVSTGVMLLLAYGIHRRHTMRVHVPVMLTAFAVDLANVIYIELRRGAVAKAFTTATTGGEWILKFHITVSVLAILGYFLALFTGLRLLTSGRGRRLHRANAVVFILDRVLNYISSFYV